MRVFGLKSCDSCRTALKELSAAGMPVTLSDVRTEPLPPDLLDRALAQFGDALVNRRSTTWRGLSEDQRASEVRALLSAHPTLMKRPLIEHEGRLFLGWASGTRAAILG